MALHGVCTPLTLSQDSISRSISLLSFSALSSYGPFLSFGDYKKGRATGAQGGLWTNCFTAEVAGLFTIPGDERQAQQVLSKSQRLWEAAAYRSTTCRTFLQSSFSRMTRKPCRGSTSYFPTTMMNTLSAYGLSSQIRQQVTRTTAHSSSVKIYLTHARPTQGIFTV